MKNIPVFYRPELVANAQSFSPSAGKPALAVESWKKLGIPIEIRTPEPATEDDLCLAHDRTYVQRVLACRIDNGFRNKLPQVAASLPYTTGAFVAAAREAISNGKVAVAPVSGFHHACYASAGGFCTFNGLVVAAQVLKRDGLASKVGILDFDQHYGNGTADIIKKCHLENWLQHYTAAKDYLHAHQAEHFLNRIPELVAAFTGCSIILYQAGADPHVNDPLGGWLTTEQLLARDCAVFVVAKELGIPVAWNLAGGYQNPIREVLDIHDNTLRACAATYGVGENVTQSEGDEHE